MLPNFFCQALQARISPWRGRQATRSFCYVDDLVDGIIALELTYPSRRTLVT